jgi:hypothetical protein
VSAQRYSPELKDREYDNVLRGRNYDTSQGALAGECGTIVK